MHNYQIGLTKNNQTQLAQQRVLERDVSTDAYWYSVPLQDMQDALRTVPSVFYVGSLPVTALPPYWALTKGAGNTAVQFYVPRNPSWINGQVFLEVHITTDDASAGNIAWEVAGTRITSGGAVGARSFAVVARDAPVAADTMLVRAVASQQTSNTGWFGVNSSHSGVVFTLGRRPGNAADTHTGDVRLHKVICKYRESGREQGSAFNANTWVVS